MLERAATSPGKEQAEGYLCPDCRQELSTPEALVAHHQARHSHLCPHCLRGLPDPGQLLAHFTEEHGAGGQERLGLLEPDRVTQLKERNQRLLREIGLLEKIGARDAVDGAEEGSPGVLAEEEGSPGVLSEEERGLLASTSPWLLEYCQRLLDTRGVEVTVARQLRGEVEGRLQGLEEAHRGLEQRLEKLRRERREMVAVMDTQLATKELQLKTARDIQ